jgi:membrane-associated protein
VIVLVGIGAAIVPVVLGALWKMLRKNRANASPH